MTGQRELETTSQTVTCRVVSSVYLQTPCYIVMTLHHQGKTRQLFMGCSDVGIDIIGIRGTVLVCTWMHPSGLTHHILINNKWKNSLRNCRAYNSVELDSDHRIVSIRLVCSLRASRANHAKDQSLTGRNFKMLLPRNSFNLNVPTDSMSSSATTCQHP